MGQHCDQCKPFFYQDPLKVISDPKACLRKLPCFTFCKNDSKQGGSDSLCSEPYDIPKLKCSYDCKSVIKPVTSKLPYKVTA